MRKILKWFGFVLAGFAAIVLIALAAIYIRSEQRINRTYQVEPENDSYRTSDELLEQGEHLAVIRGCTDCHGDNLGGEVMIADPMIGVIAASNLTSGEGGVAETYTDPELARAIRHGIDAEGQGLIVMPSQEFFVLSDGDVAALIAYIRSLEPVDNSLPERNLTLMARALFVAGQLPPLAAEVIDHEEPHPEAPAPAANAEYGKYLATGCIGCHGADYSGGPIPGGPPGSPPAPNLTPAGNLGNWTESDFINTLRTGETPGGRQLDPEFMPWTATAQMSELELKAIWAFLQTLPPTESN